MSAADITVIVMVVLSTIGIGVIYLVRALEDTRKTTEAELDIHLPPLDYTQYRGYWD